MLPVAPPKWKCWQINWLLYCSHRGKFFLVNLGILGLLRWYGAWRTCNWMCFYHATFFVLKTLVARGLFRPWFNHADMCRFFGNITVAQWAVDVLLNSFWSTVKVCFDWKFAFTVFNISSLALGWRGNGYRDWWWWEGSQEPECTTSKTIGLQKHPNAIGFCVGVCWRVFFSQDRGLQ